MTDKKTTLFSLKSEFDSLKTEVLEKISAIEERFNTPNAPKLAEPQEVNVQTSVPEVPIPLEYRMIVDETLNKSFGIKIAPRYDAPMFEFIIVVPEKYSTMTAEQKKMLGVDVRPRVLTYAEGINGVRTWCETVYNSFSNELKGQITADRS